MRPICSPADPLASLFCVLLGRYPEVVEIGIDYPRRVRAALEMPDRTIAEDEGLSPDFLRSATPLAFTGVDLSQRRDRSGWLHPGVIFGAAADFDDLPLLWNLQAAGASVSFTIARKRAAQTFRRSISSAGSGGHDKGTKSG